MHKKTGIRMLRTLLEGGLTCLILACGAPLPQTTVADSTNATSTVIVQGADFEAAADAVASAGGTVTHELGIIRAVGARVTAAERRALERNGAGTGIFDDRREIGRASGRERV